MFQLTPAANSETTAPAQYTYGAVLKLHPVSTITVQCRKGLIKNKIDIVHMYLFIAYIAQTYPISTGVMTSIYNRNNDAFPEPLYNGS